MNLRQSSSCSHSRFSATMRRRVGYLALVWFALIVFPGAVGAVARAQPAAGVSQIDGLSWMNIHDSAGAPLANYTFASDSGGILEPGNSIIWALIGLEFIGYITIVTAAIWLVGHAMSFRWLDMFGSALRAMADGLKDQISIPILLVTAATIGAFFVALFVARGHYAKATTQVITMLGVAVLGPVFLADPLAEVLSSHGLLAQGRDLGLSVAAGLNGHSSADVGQLIATTQATLADSFARRPLQVWNFGHVVDERPSCRSAWTAGMLAGDDERVKTGMRTCGDVAAYAKATNPSLGQVGTGLLLLICAGALLAFAVYLSVKIMKAALDSIYYAFTTVLGFAAGGFVYGPTQTHLVRSLVHSAIAAARMTVYTILLGFYVLFIGNLFLHARGQVLAVIVVAGVVEIIAISQLRRIGRSLDGGGDWISNRFGLAIQNPGAQSQGAGGRALGMGSARGAGAAGPGLVGGLAALNTVNASPITAWLAAGTMNPLNPLAFGRRVVESANIAVTPSRRELYAWGHWSRANWRAKALQRAEPHGGMQTRIGAAHALDGLGDSRVPEAHLPAAMRATGASDQYTIDALRALTVQNASMSKNPFGFAPLQKAVASAYAVENHVGDRAHEAFAAQASVAADNFARHTNAPRPGADIDHGFVATVRRHWDSDSALQAAITPEEWNTVGRDTRRFIGDELAKQHQAAARTYYRDQSASNRARLMRSADRIANLDHMDSSAGLDPWDP
ncbi:hypothetical protein [Nocardia wallacei]|uniref:hypothetical protein n=1 Tax=Nocardia wallacei TaxID=480035 RepID=UPI002458CCFE|nr:hypothetical protein [Nocardia wallacei]